MRKKAVTGYAAGYVLPPMVILKGENKLNHEWSVGEGPIPSME